MREQRRLIVPPSTLDRDDFVAMYGGVYEHSPHFAADVFPQTRTGTLDTLAGLSDALQQAVHTGGHEAQLRLILAHPDLADKIRTAPLTTQSANEQSGAGLDKCSPAEFDEFVSLNRSYREKFGFPFIKAVRGFSRAGILEAFRRRISNDIAVEFRTAVDEIHKIALLRLTDLAEQDVHD